jgi:hypothetical protein
MTLYDELGKVLKIKRKGDESLDDFTARVTKKVNALKDSEWGELTEELQIWCNQTMEAREKGDEVDLPVLEGWPSAVEEEAADSAEAADTNEGEEPGDEEAGDEEDVDAAAEAAEAADSLAKSAKKPSTKESTKTPAKKPVAAAKPAKSAKSTQKEKGPMPAKKTAAAATTVPAAAAAKKKVANGAAKAKAGRQSKFSESAKIKILVKENPHREGTGRFDRWRKYKEGMTVGQALKAGLKPVNLHYSVEDGHIKIVNA